jgi:hypothetical protein
LGSGVFFSGTLMFFSKTDSPRSPWLNFASTAAISGLYFFRGVDFVVGKSKQSYFPLSMVCKFLQHWLALFDVPNILHLVSFLVGGGYHVGVVPD